MGVGKKLARRYGGWLHVAHEWKLDPWLISGVNRRQGAWTRRQMLVALAWLDQDLGRPDKHCWYLMRVAQRAQQAGYVHPGVDLDVLNDISVDDQRIEFLEKGDPRLLEQQQRQQQRGGRMVRSVGDAATSKRAWKGATGADVLRVTREQAAYLKTLTREEASALKRLWLRQQQAQEEQQEAQLPRRRKVLGNPVTDPEVLA